MIPTMVRRRVPIAVLCLTLCRVTTAAAASPEQPDAPPAPTGAPVATAPTSAGQQPPSPAAQAADGEAPARPAPRPTAAKAFGSSPSGEAPPEVGLAALQLLSGSLGMGVVMLPFISLNTPLAIEAILVLAPAAGGGIVCGVGSLSPYYSGRCGAPMLGAYIGSALAMAVVYGVSRSQPNSFDSTRGEAVLWGGYIVATTAGATIGWHFWSKPRAMRNARVTGPALATRRADEWPELGRVPMTSSPHPMRLSVPLLAFAF
jgi:hypothetical protein